MNKYYKVTFRILHPSASFDGYVDYVFQVYTTSETRAVVESTKYLMRGYPGADPDDAIAVDVEQVEEH